MLLPSLINLFYQFSVLKEHIDFSKVSRINVIGSSGSGKSTFAKKVSEILNFPHIEMDNLFWNKDWRQSEDEEFLKKLKVALYNKVWVLDGNYFRTTSIKWANVDLVIWLDYSFSRTFYRAVKRAVIRSLTKKELWKGTGNTESFRRAFLSKESILLWVINSYPKVNKRYNELIKSEEYPHIKFLKISTTKESEKFLYELKELIRLQPKDKERDI